MGISQYGKFRKLKLLSYPLVSKTNRIGLKRVYLKIEKQVVDAFYSDGNVKLKNSHRRIGINEGDTLLVHSSFKYNNGFKGTPKDIIECLLEVLGERGNLAIVSLPFTTSAHEYLSRKPVFDINRTPASTAGAVAKYGPQWAQLAEGIHKFLD